MKEYDVKLLVNRLEVKVGRKMSEYAASTGISVILKWIEKSVIKTENKLDDSVLLLYPALISFLSTKIDMKEFKGDFEVEEAFDIKELAEQLKVYGLIVAEETVIDVVEVSLSWVIESARASENPYDNVIEMVIPVVLAPLNEHINKISDDINSSIEINNPDHSE